MFSKKLCGVFFSRYMRVQYLQSWPVQIPQCKVPPWEIRAFNKGLLTIVVCLITPYYLNPYFSWGYVEQPWFTCYFHVDVLQTVSFSPLQMEMTFFLLRNLSILKGNFRWGVTGGTFFWGEHPGVILVLTERRVVKTLFNLFFRGKDKEDYDESQLLRNIAMGIIHDPICMVYLPLFTININDSCR